METFGKSFDKLIQHISSRYHLGPKGRSLVHEALDLIVNDPGGIGGFLDRLRAAGLTVEVASWLAGSDPVPLSGQEVEQTLGFEAIHEIANRADVSERFARTVLGYAIPKITCTLAQTGLLDVAIATASSRADDIPHYEEGQSPLGELEKIGALPWYRKLFSPIANGPTFNQVVVPAASLLIVLGLFGYLVSTGGAHHAATQPTPVMAKNAPIVVKPAPTALVHHAAMQSSSATGKNARVVVPQASSIPARLALSNKNGHIVYSGIVEDDVTRTSIIDLLKTVFGADRISGGIVVDKHAGSADWAQYLKTSISNFKTPGSEALFEGETVSVGGTIPAADRDRIMSSLISTLGPKFVLTPMTGTGETETAITSPPLKSDISGKQPVSVSDQLAFNLPTIYFGTDSAEVPSGSKADLERAAVNIKQLPAGTTVRVSGFTDSTGSRAVNMKLSQRRADAIRQVLVDAGVNPSILSAKGHGIYPSAASKSGMIDGRSSSTVQNRLHEDRRVEMQIVHEKGT